MKKRDRIEIIAYHEAGHAVMAIWQKRCVWEIAIKSELEGVMFHNNKIEWALKYLNRSYPHDRVRFMNVILEEVKILLAGPIVECELRNLPLRGSGSPTFTDFEDIVTILSRPGVIELFQKYVPGGLDALGDEVINWVHQKYVWNYIRLIAEYVMIKMTIDWDDIMNLLIVNNRHRSQLNLLF